MQMRLDGEREQGFTLIELLVSMGLAMLLLTLSAWALRGYWFEQSLEGGSEDIISQLRQLQESSVSESHPIVFGARFEEGSSNYLLLRYNPKEPAVAGDDECTEEGTRAFETRVVVDEAEFDPPSGILPSLCPGSGDHFVFFFARGTATGGYLVLSQPERNDTRTITVSGLTGRVEEERASESSEDEEEEEEDD
jgi:prepilin-type N-terminal cleavage/methylation domain-containing protein